LFFFFESHGFDFSQGDIVFFLNRTAFDFSKGGIVFFLNRMAFDFSKGGIVFYSNCMALDFLGDGCFKEGLLASFELIVDSGTVCNLYSKINFEVLYLTQILIFLEKNKNIRCRLFITTIITTIGIGIFQFYK